MARTSVRGRARVPWSASAAVLLALWPAAALGQEITVGPYWFPDESLFADTAVYYGEQLDRWYPPYFLGTDETSLLGYTPDDGLINLGIADNTSECLPRELLDIGFVDVAATNGPGADLVIFDARYSIDDYEVAVRPRGGTLSAFRFHLAADQVPTGVHGPAASWLWGVEIDLSEYGIPIGVEVDLVRIAGDCATTPSGWVEMDPVMAAVLRAPCACDDGVECTWDCGARGECASVPHDAGTPCSEGVCDGATSPSCVECLEDAHCPSDRPRCDPARHACVACVEGAHCDDGLECTADRCEGDVCRHEPLAAGEPCTGGFCDGEGQCAQCVDDAHCDDGVECTEDRCVERACVVSARPAGAPCSVGFCVEAPEPRCVECASDAGCGEFTPYCVEGRCIACRTVGDCAPVECADVSCELGACASVAHPVGTLCDEGLCTGDPGAPRCVECLRADDCPITAFCDDDRRCATCMTAADCDDGDANTLDACDAGACVHAALWRDAGPEHVPPPAPGCACAVGARSPSSPAALFGLALALIAISIRCGRR